MRSELGRVHLVLGRLDADVQWRLQVALVRFFEGVGAQIREDSTFMSKLKPEGVKLSVSTSRVRVSTEYR